MALLAPRPCAPLGVQASRRLCYSADRVGFEPTKRLPVYALSRRVPSATRPPIQTARRADAQAHRRVVNTQAVTVSPQAARPMNPDRGPVRIMSVILPPFDPRRYQ